MKWGENRGPVKEESDIGGDRYGCRTRASSDDSRRAIISKKSENPKGFRSRKEGSAIETCHAQRFSDGFVTEKEGDSTEERDMCISKSEISGSIFQRDMEKRTATSLNELDRRRIDGGGGQI